MRAGLFQLLVLPLLWLVGTPILLTVIFGTLVLWPTAKADSKSVPHLPITQVQVVNNQTQPTLNFTQTTATPSSTLAKQTSTLSYKIGTTRTGTAAIEINAVSPITSCSVELIGPNFNHVEDRPASADSSGCNFLINDLNGGEYQFKISATKLSGGTAKTFGGFTVF